MKKKLYLISALCLLWITYVIYSKYNEAQKILIIEKKNTACRYFDINLGILVMKPNCVAERKLKDVSTIVTFNEAGIPSPNLPEKNPKVLRIFLLGGSNLVGLGIPDEYYPQKVLQEEFEKALNKKIELINVAVEGYVTAQHAIVFPTFYKTYNPDVVIDFTTSSHKVFRNALLFTYTQKDSKGNFTKLMPLELPKWFFELSLTNQFVNFIKQIIRTSVENIRLMKLEREIKNVEDNKELQAEMLFSPTIQYFNSMKKAMEENGSSEYFYAITDNADFENFHPQRLFELDSVDLMFRFFHPKLVIKNGEFKSYLKKAQIKTINIEATFSPDEVFHDTYYFNKVGMRKFAQNLAHNFAQEFNKK